MATSDDARIPPFRPDDLDSCAAEWEDYKRMFLVHLDAKGLHDAAGRRKVGQLLSCMGSQHIATYDSFTWQEEIPAIAADPERGILARQRVPAEDQYSLTDVFKKFDEQFGVHRFRSIKRQEFLRTQRGEKQTAMQFISELKRKARYCDYGNLEDGFICDMIINKINDRRCTERLMELNDQELTLANVTRICRQMELTQAHVDGLHSTEKDTKSEKEVHKVMTRRGRGRGSFRPQQSDYHGGSSNFQRRTGETYNHRRDRGYHLERGDDFRRNCPKCCRNHWDGQCRAAKEYCGACGQRGHYKRSRLCPKYSRGRGRNVHEMTVRRMDGQFPGNDEYYDYDGLDNDFQNCAIDDVFQCTSLNDNEQDECHSDDAKGIYVQSRRCCCA